MQKYIVAFAHLQICRSRVLGLTVATLNIMLSDVSRDLRLHHRANKASTSVRLPLSSNLASSGEMPSFKSHPQKSHENSFDNLSTLQHSEVLK